MGLPVLIIGKSGSGKSASLRNFQPGEIGIINVLGKALPFKNNLKTVVVDEYEPIIELLEKGKSRSIVIDDAGYLITNMFMRGHSKFGEGSAIFNFYNKLGDSFWGLLEHIKKLPDEKIVYFFMHEDKSDYGDVKPKTIGKMLDEKVCVEGMFTILFRAAKEKGKYVFFTTSQGFDVSKTPMGMFTEATIDNDLKAVDKIIREFYGLTGGNANV